VDGNVLMISFVSDAGEDWACIPEREREECKHTYQDHYFCDLICHENYNGLLYFKFFVVSFVVFHALI
jgi:hypothetical protein